MAYGDNAALWLRRQIIQPGLGSGHHLFISFPAGAAEIPVASFEPFGVFLCHITPPPLPLTQVHLTQSRVNFDGQSKSRPDDGRRLLGAP